MRAQRSYRSPRILVAGAGAVGGVIAARLTLAGHDVTVLDANPVHVTRLISPGLRLDEPGSSAVVPLAAVSHPADLAGMFDFALLTVKAPALTAVLTALVGLDLARCYVSLGNGLVQARVEAVTGPDRLITGIIEWGATNIGPGHVVQTTRAPFVLDGSGDKGQVAGLAGILQAAAPVRISGNIHGQVWAKLLLNSTFSGLGAVGGRTYAQVAAHRDGPRLACALWTEGYDTGRAAGVEFDEVVGILPADLVVRSEPDLERAGQALAVLLRQVGATKASMLQDLERGIPTEVDVINGGITAQAASLGRAAPLNQRVVDVVHECERGLRRPGNDALAAVASALPDQPSTPGAHVG
jgi:2-dehydropantoate 2-reductase